MRVILEPTDLIVHLNGVRCRIWQGETGRGLQVLAHIALIGVDADADASELLAELKEVAAPRADVAALAAGSLCLKVGT